jgi:hypothetical protein
MLVLLAAEGRGNREIGEVPVAATTQRRPVVDLRAGSMDNAGDE